MRTLFIISLISDITFLLLFATVNFITFIAVIYNFIWCPILLCRYSLISLPFVCIFTVNSFTVIFITNRYNNIKYTIIFISFRSCIYNYSSNNIIKTNSCCYLICNLIHSTIIYAMNVLIYIIFTFLLLMAVTIKCTINRCIISYINGSNHSILATINYSINLLSISPSISLITVSISPSIYIPSIFSYLYIYIYFCLLSGVNLYHFIVR